MVVTNSTKIEKEKRNHVIKVLTNIKNKFYFKTKMSKRCFIKITFCLSPILLKLKKDTCLITSVFEDCFQVVISNMLFLSVFLLLSSFIIYVLLDETCLYHATIQLKYRKGYRCHFDNMFHGYYKTFLQFLKSVLPLFRGVHLRLREPQPRP